MLPSPSVNEKEFWLDRCTQKKKKKKDKKKKQKKKKKKKKKNRVKAN